MCKGWLLVAALAAMILAAPTAWAQRGGGRGGFGGGGAMLLGQKSVQAELKLSDEQTAKVTTHLEKQRGAFAELRDLSREERAAKMRERATANEAALKEILTADQLKRLKQITLQQRGASALADDEVADAVGLTADQKEKVRSINSEMRGLFQGGGGEDREAMRKKFEEARASSNTKLEALLTPEQQTKWKELNGEPFKGEIQRPQGRGNRQAAAVSRSAGQLVSLKANASAASRQDDNTWNQVDRLLNAEPRAVQFAFAVHRGETPVQLAGVHKPPKPNPAKMRRKVHRQNQRQAHWANHHAAISEFAPQWMRDDQVALTSGSEIETRTAERHAFGFATHEGDTPILLAGAHHPPKPNPAKMRRKVHRQNQHNARHDARRPKHHHASHRDGGPRHHQFARHGHMGHRYAHHGFADHHRYHGEQGPQFARFRHDPGRPHFASRPHHRPNHFAGWSRDHGGPARAHFAQERGPRGGHPPGHGPRAEFSSHRPGGHHFHMSSWHRHAHGENRHGEHRHGRHRDGDPRDGDRDKDRRPKHDEKHRDRD